MPKKRNPYTGLYMPALLGGAAATTYIDIVNGVQTANLIAFWPLNETSGTAAVDQVDSPTQDGLYSGPTLAQVSDPFGETLIPSFDGVNDFVDNIVNIDSNFNGAEGSFNIWVLITDAVFKDNTSDMFIRLQVDSNNFIWIRKKNEGGAVRYDAAYKAGGTQDYTGALGGIAGDVWNMFTITWSASNDRVRLYDNATLCKTMTTLGTWAGSLDASNTVLFAGSDVPADLFKGDAAYPAVWNTELDSADITTLYNGGPV